MSGKAIHSKPPVSRLLEVFIYDPYEEAAEARSVAEKKYFGEFAPK